MIEVCTFITELCDITENKESVGKALRNVELFLVLLRKLDSEPFSVCRTSLPQVDRNIENLDVEYLYEAPMMLEREELAQRVLEKLHLEVSEPDHSDWQAMLDRLRNAKGVVKIAIVGKYVALHDAYLSVAEALRHGAISNDTHVRIKWIDSEKLEDGDINLMLDDVDGVVIPGGFGMRGIEGKIKAINYVREHNIPFLGICLGMQLALVEATRNILGYKDANSLEFNPNTSCPIIHLLKGQEEIDDIGGTLRLGAYPCHLKENTLA